MKITKQLVLVFNDEIGQDYTLRINDPKDDLEELDILNAMEMILEKK